MGLAGQHVEVFGKEIGSTTNGCHVHPVVLQEDTAALDRSSCTGGIIPTLHSALGINHVNNTFLRDQQVTLASPNLLCRRGGTSRGGSSSPPVYPSSPGAARFFIFNAGVGFEPAFMILCYLSRSFIPACVVSFRNKSLFRILMLTPAPSHFTNLPSGNGPQLLVTIFLGFLPLLLKIGVSIDMSRMILPCVFYLLPLMCLLHNKSGPASSVLKKAGVGVMVLS